MEGRNSLGAMSRSIRFLAIEILSSLGHYAVEEPEPEPEPEA